MRHDAPSFDISKAALDTFNDFKLAIDIRCDGFTCEE